MARLVLGLLILALAAWLCRPALSLAPALLAPGWTIFPPLPPGFWWLHLALPLALVVAAMAIWWPRRPYRIQFNGRAGVTYTDARGVVEVDGEMLVGEKSYVVYADRMRLERPGTRASIDDGWRREILERIEKAVGRGRLEIEHG